MQAFGSKLRRHIWQPLLLIMAAIAAAPAVFAYLLPPTLLWMCVYALGLILICLVITLQIDRRVVEPVRELARVAEEFSPGILRDNDPATDEITNLAGSVSRITAQIREKEETWIGDLEQRTQAVAELSRNLQEQAANFETALNSMDYPICLFESSGNILQVNHRFRQYMGQSAEQLKAMGFLPIASELRKQVTTPDKLMETAESMYRTPSEARDVVVPLQGGKGGVRLYCVPVFGELSSMVGIIISTGNAAPHTEVEHLKSEFISTVSHELRTPLTAIKGAVGLVLGGAGGPVPGPIRDLLDIANQNTERLIQLVSDIIEIFRMEAGKLQLRPAPVDVPELVARSRSLAVGQIDDAGIHLESHLTPGLPLLLVDIEQMEKVLAHLITNAMKFSSPGGKVMIGADLVSDNASLLRLWVQDFGKGIPPDAQSRIFEKFEQAESVLTREHQGTGLGLAICLGIVEGHGGKIWVQSEVGKGSTFFLTLPVAHAPTSVRDGALDGDGAPAAGAARPVLLVDDDPGTRRIISRMLQSEGHKVVESATGGTVAELALRHQPGVITLDLLLPDINGLEVLKQLKGNEDTRRIPVICVSVSDDLASEALRLGAAMFLRKPLEMETFLRAVQTASTTVTGSTAG